MNQDPLNVDELVSRLSTAGLHGRQIVLANTDIHTVLALIEPERMGLATRLLEASAQVCGVEVDSVTEPGKRREVTTARNLAMYLIREECRWSFPVIGRFLGGQVAADLCDNAEPVVSEHCWNHATVLLACRRVRAGKAARSSVPILSQQGKPSSEKWAVLIAAARSSAGVANRRRAKAA